MAVVASLMELSQTVCDVNELHSCQWLDFRAGLRQALRHQDVKDIDTYLNKIVTVSYFVSVQNRETKILMSCGEVCSLLRVYKLAYCNNVNRAIRVTLARSYFS